MVYSIQLALLFVSVMALGQIKHSSALHVETTPDPFSKLIDKELNITCITDGKDYMIKTVVTIEVAKVDQKPIAVFSQQQLTDGPNMKSNMKAEGHIEKDASKSFLRLTIADPHTEDAGQYTCVVFYLDDAFEIQEERVFTNVSFDHSDVTAIVTHLWSKVTDLEKTVQKQARVISDQDKMIHDLQEQNMEKGNFTSAFSAGFARHDNFTEDETIKFRVVYLNLGNDYNTSSGIYTAPRSGVYVFHLTALMGQDEWLQIHLHAADRVVAALYAWAKDQPDQSSVSTAVSLQAGDQVWPLVVIDTSKSHSVGDFYYSIFSGYLLHLL